MTTKKISRFSPVGCQIWSKQQRLAFVTVGVATWLAIATSSALSAPPWTYPAWIAVFALLYRWRERLEFRPDAVEVENGRLIVRGRRELDVSTSAIRRTTMRQDRFYDIVPRNLIERLTGHMIRFRTFVTVEMYAASVDLSFEYPHEARAFVGMIRR